MAESLSVRLRADTASVHRLAERSGIMRDILGGRLERSSYVALLANLYVVYDALERSLEGHQASSLLQPFPFAVLARRSALAGDLAVLHGDDWQTAVHPSGAALAYAHVVNAAVPLQLVAHAYVRYLGDLSGGQALKKVVGRALGLRGSGGLSFYDFPEIADLDVFKGQFRELLDAMTLTPDECDGVVAEAVRAFELNINLFAAVATQTSSSDAPPLPHGG